MTNRLQELAADHKIIGERVQGHQEKLWRVRKEDMAGQGYML